MKIDRRLVAIMAAQIAANRPEPFEEAHFRRIASSAARLALTILEEVDAYADPTRNDGAAHDRHHCR